MEIGKIGHHGVHASLVLEAEDKGRIAFGIVTLLETQQPLEEGLAAIREPDGMQLLVADLRVGSLLLHHGGQLLMVSNEHEAADSIHPRMACTEQTQKMGLQNL